MRWIEDKVFANEEYKEERARLEAQCNRLLSQYSNNFHNEEEVNYFRRVVYSYLTGNFNKSNGEGLANLLHRNGVPQTEGTRMYTDPEYDDFIKSLVEIHDRFLDAAIAKYDFATDEEITNSREKELQMYGSLIGGLLVSSGKVGQGKAYTSATFRSPLKREELIPHDRLFEYGKQVLRELNSKRNYSPTTLFPRDMYEELLLEIENRIKIMTNMSNEEYVAEKKELLNESKIRQKQEKNMEH